MNDKKPFSKRLGLSRNPKEIVVREDAPEDLRNYIRIAFYNISRNPSRLRTIVCQSLKKAPNNQNWTEFPNIDNEVEELLAQCDWYYVYDIIEKIIQNLQPAERQVFTEDINEFFIENGIGWKIVGEELETRGDEIFEAAVSNVVHILDDANLKTAKKEIKEAIQDLSRRPDPRYYWSNSTCLGLSRMRHA